MEAGDWYIFRKLSGSVVEVSFYLVGKGIGFFGVKVKFHPENNLTLIHRQLYPNLALADHTSHEVMRVSAIFTWEK